MNTVKGELASFNKLKDLKTLLSATGPCLSVYMPLSTASTAGKNPNAKQNELHWREILATVEEKVAQFGSVGRELVDSVHSWDAIASKNDKERPLEGKSIAVFRSPEIFQIVALDGEVPERAVFGPHFYIRPMLAELTHDREFYLLALSQKNTRLLRCTTHTSEEVPLPHQTQTDFDHWMNQAKPDHRAVNNAMTGGAGGGSVPNAVAPKGSDDEAKEEYLAHFFKQINHGVTETLRGKTEPLVLCAVEYEIPIYREVSSYPHLADETVHGAPNSLKAGEMHARALEALDRCYQEKVAAALKEWDHRVGGGASSRLKDVVTAAHDGRILTLLVSNSQEKTGVFDEATHTVKGRETGSNEDEDLLNDAAVQTILHAGNVLVASQAQMPNGSPMAAIFRY